MLDGYSRAIVHWKIAASITQGDVEMVLQKGLEKYPQAKPRIISDNGPQFIGKDFKEYIRLTGLTHVRTSPYYPQSNGKLERWNKSFKLEGWRPGLAETEREARALIEKYVEHYNTVRLHSAIGYIAPQDKLNGREKAIWKQRDEQLENARKHRAKKRRAAYTREIVESLAKKWSVSSSE